MTPPNLDAKRGYLDGIASKLEDPNAYLEFLAAKLDGQETGLPEAAAVTPLDPGALAPGALDPGARTPGSSTTPAS